jgi:hypothetical protein
MRSILLSGSVIGALVTATEVLIGRPARADAVIESRSLSIDAIEGSNVKTSQLVSLKLLANPATVVIFVSATCPCSQSHVVELKSLAKDFPEFQFVGIHSNGNEGKQASQSYFQSLALPFEVIRDRGAKLADLFRASKTPHAFVINRDRQVVYRGGVSSSSQFHAQVERRFLREALDDLRASRAVRTPEGRTLGCAITRGGEGDW